MISAINHVTLSVTDIEKSFEFYRSVLNLKPLALRKGKSAYLLAGDDWIALVQSKNQTDLQRDYSHIAFSVPANEFEQVALKIKNSGAEIWQENTSPGESLYFLDPSGNRLEIHTGDWKSRLQWLKANPSEDVILFPQKEE